MDLNNSSWWRDNLSLVVGSLSAGLIALRLLVVARGDPETAYAILQAGGTAAILTGTLVSVVGLIAAPISFLLFFYAWLHFCARRTQGTTSWIALFGASAVSAYIAIFAAPAALLLLGIALGFVVWLVLRQPRIRGLIMPEDDSHPKSRGSIPSWAYITIICYLALTMITQLWSPKPWLPIQSIETKTQTFNGYVLSETNGDAYILTATPTGVTQVPSSSIESATECKPSSSFVFSQETLAEIIESPYRTSYPACPFGRFYPNKVP